MNHPLVIAEAGVITTAISARERYGSGRGGGWRRLCQVSRFPSGRDCYHGAKTAAYQAVNTGVRSQHELLRALEISLDALRDLAEECRRHSIRFLCTPFDVSMTRELIDMGMDRIKVASGELTNAPALGHFAQFGVPVILSTGMATIDEVDGALSALQRGGAGEITLLHCTSLYPAPPETLNLRAMVTLAQRFGVPVGYSDHSLDDYAAVAAVALGAIVIEKHFTLDRNLPGPDHRASLEPDEFALLVTKIRKTAVSLGDGNKRPAPGEADTARLVRRSWHAAHALDAGIRLSESDMSLRRPADGLAPADSPVGRVLARRLAPGAPIGVGDLVPTRS